MLPRLFMIVYLSFNSLHFMSIASKKGFIKIYNEKFSNGISQLVSLDKKMALLFIVDKFPKLEFGI